MTPSFRSIDVLSDAVRLAGIVHAERTDEGVTLHRMPAWARTQHNDPSLPVLEAMPSGARIEMRTDATEIEIDAHLTLIQLLPRPVAPAVFELFVDGTPCDEQRTSVGTLVVIDPRSSAIEFVPGGADTIRFAGLPEGDKRVEIWLPHASVVTLKDLRANGSASKPARAGRRWVHYGSSISHCFEAARPTNVWPVVAARRAGTDLLNLGFAGQCHLDPFAARIIAQQPADLVSVKLGVNIVNGDTMRERTFVPAVHGVLDTIRDRHPVAPLLVISPIIFPAAEDHPGPTRPNDVGQVECLPRSPELSVGSLTIRRIRELEEQIVAQRRSDGDENLHYLDGQRLFGASDTGDLPDGLHPNSEGYVRMGERFYEIAFVRGPFRD